MMMDRRVFISPELCFRGLGGSASSMEPHTAVAPLHMGSCFSMTAQQREAEHEKNVLSLPLPLSVPLHSRGSPLPRCHREAVFFGLPIKGDHTANMKYTNCVERLIKY